MPHARPATSATCTAPTPDSPTHTRQRAHPHYALLPPHTAQTHHARAHTHTHHTKYPHLHPHVLAPLTSGLVASGTPKAHGTVRTRSLPKTAPFAYHSVPDRSAYVLLAIRRRVFPFLLQRTVRVNPRHAEVPPMPVLQRSPCAICSRPPRSSLLAKPTAGPLFGTGKVKKKGNDWDAPGAAREGVGIVPFPLG